MSNTLPIVIWGASGHAKVIADILRLRGEYHVVGFLDDTNPANKGHDFFGAQILGGSEQIESLRADGVGSIALGFGSCAGRIQVSRRIKSCGFDLVTVIHPSATISPYSRLGKGSAVCSGAIICPECEIGEAVIVNTSASVDHDCKLGDGVNICPGVRVAGRVTIGQGTWVGIGSTISDGLKVGTCSMIGAGSVVVRDIPDSVVAYGVPARPMRQATGDF